MTKRLFKIISYILVLLSFVFIYRALSSLDLENLAHSFNIQTFIFILFSSFLYSLNTAPFAIAWRKLLILVSGEKVPVKMVLNLYFRSNIAKYLPGNVFHFAGRHLLVNEKIVGHYHLLFANIIEIGLLILTSCIMVTAGVFSGQIQIPEKVISLIQLKFLFAGSALALSVLAIAVLFLYKHNKLDILIRIFHILKPGKIVHLFYAALLYSIMFITTGAILYFILVIITPGGFSCWKLLQVIFIFTLAWVAGYIVPGAPGGVGIREAILIIMLSASYEASVIAMASLILRFITILGDIMTYIYSSIPILKYSVCEETQCQ